MQSGFGNHLESEFIKDTLPIGQNNPQKSPYGLYTEQLSGSPFTMPRHQIQRSWLYRRLPSVNHQPFESYSGNPLFIANCKDSKVSSIPNQLRWNPFPLLGGDFIDSLGLIGKSGSPSQRNGIAIYIYHCNESMTRKAFYNSDGDLLIVPQSGIISIRTEFGIIDKIVPKEIVVIQRGIKFSVELIESSNPGFDLKESLLSIAASGYILEVYNGHFELPDLGPIGANGLANPQDFYHPIANAMSPLPSSINDKASCNWQIINKFNGQLFKADQNHTPFDVVAWRGNYVPYRYDLTRFSTINSVSHDHPDPSIFTVLTVKGAIPGQAIADFVIFPPRWSCSDHTFRPPYFHRNCMTEFMGLIQGSYEAKQDGGFLPGGFSLHSMCTPHGPDSKTFEIASNCELKPSRVGDGTLAFMFETSLIIEVSEWALNHSQKDYFQIWQKFKPAEI